MNEHGGLILLLVVVALVLTAFILGMISMRHTRRLFGTARRIRKDSACRRCDIERRRRLMDSVDKEMRR